MRLAVSQLDYLDGVDYARVQAPRRRLLTALQELVELIERPQPL